MFSIYLSPANANSKRPDALRTTFPIGRKFLFARPRHLLKRRVLSMRNSLFNILFPRNIFILRGRQYEPTKPRVPHFSRFLREVGTTKRVGRPALSGAEGACPERSRRDILVRRFDFLALPWKSGHSWPRSATKSIKRA